MQIQKTEEWKLEEVLREFSKRAREKLKQAKQSGIMRDDVQQQDAYLLQKAVIDSLCRDRPYQGLDKHTINEFDRLHEVIKS